MKTDEELAAELFEGPEEEGLDDFDLNVEEVRKGNFDDVVESTHMAQWAEQEQEAKMKAVREVQEASDRSRDQKEDGASGNEPRSRQQKGEANAAIHESLLSTSYYNLVQPKYSEKPWVASKPYSTPAFYPQVQHPSVCSAETFKDLDRDTLFFAFYYQQQTYQQYLAARQLKSLSWRYHKAQNAWFQRAEKPTETADDYERGSYTFFDYKTDWTCKNVDNFVFEYKHLEDDLQVPVAVGRYAQKPQDPQPAASIPTVSAPPSLTPSNSATAATAATIATAAASTP